MILYFSLSSLLVEAGLQMLHVFPPWTVNSLAYPSRTKVSNVCCKENLLRVLHRGRSCILKSNILVHVTCDVRLEYSRILQSQEDVLETRIFLNIRVFMQCLKRTLVVHCTQYQHPKIVGPCGSIFVYMHIRGIAWLFPRRMTSSAYRCHAPSPNRTRFDFLFHFRYMLS